MISQYLWRDFQFHYILILYIYPFYLMDLLYRSRS